MLPVHDHTALTTTPIAAATCLAARLGTCEANASGPGMRPS